VKAYDTVHNDDTTYDTAHYDVAGRKYNIIAILHKTRQWRIENNPVMIKSTGQWTIYENVLAFKAVRKTFNKYF